MAAAERKLKHKLYPVNAMLEIEHCDTLQAAPKEELHQMLIGFYGEHVIPATFYEVKETLRRPDLVLSRTRDGAVSRYAVSDDMIKGVFARLRDRLTSCGSSDLMIQVSPEYGSHFLAMYLEPEVKHLTGDRVKVLMLSLPFLLRDLIKPEVKAPTKRYRIRYRMQYRMRYRMRLQQTPCLERVPSDPAVLWLQVEYVNRLIRSAKRGDCLFVEEIEDPSDKLIEVHLAVLRYNMQSRRFGLTAPGLIKLRDLAAKLLELVKTNMLKKSGEQNAWKFE